MSATRSSIGRMPHFGAAAITILMSSAPAFADWTYNPSTGHWYRLTTSYGTWAEANAEAIAAGGYLVTICDDTENDWVAQFAANTFDRTAGTENIAWIGYRDAGSGFGWENGESCPYTNLAGCPCCGDWPAYSGAHAYIHGANHVCPEKWNHNAAHDDDFNKNPRGVIEREVDPAVPALSDGGLS